MPKATTPPSTFARMSVQERARASLQEESPLTFSIARVADEIAEYGSTSGPLARDRDLDNFWRTEPILAGAVYSMVAKVAALDFELKGAPKAVSRYENVLLSADFGSGWVHFIQKVCEDIFCLAGRTRIHLGGERRGQTKSIAQIVKDRDTGPVLSLDHRGHIVEKQITRWYKSPLGDRRWWWMSLKNVSGHSRDQRGGIFVTEEHPVLTGQGWMSARDVRCGMMVATGDSVPSHDQAEMLAGTVLGDASIAKIRKRSVLRFTHSVKQEEWLDFKLSALQGFQWTGRAKRKSTIRGVETESVSLNSRGSVSITEWKKAWYPRGKKVVARDYVSRYFSPRMMATWYCDDGSLLKDFTRAGNPTSPHMAFYTNGFTRKDVEWLAGFLCGKGFPCNVYLAGGKYPIISITCEGTRRLAKFMGAYVPPSMRYKLPDDAPSYDSSLWDIEPARTYFDEVVVSEPREYRSGYTVTKTTYNIGVEETENYVAANTVVHNCSDNGGFIELLRPSNSEATAAVHSVAHLDSFRCKRTGKPDIPIQYRTQSRGNKLRPLHWWEVIPLADMPSPREELKGIGYCSISRVLRAAQTLRDIGLRKRQKLAGKRVPAILFAQGIRRNAVREALEQTMEEQLNRGESLYTAPAIISSPDPALPLDVKLIELAGLPEGYDEDTTLKWYIATLAMGFGTDYTEFAPLPGGGLGTATQSTEMAARARGKGPGVILQQLEFAINWYILPESVEFQFASTDPIAEQEEMQMRLWRGRDRAVRLQRGELTAPQALRLAVLDGDAPEDFLEDEEIEEEVDVLVRSVGQLQDSYYEIEQRILKRLNGEHPYTLITGEVIDG